MGEARPFNRPTVFSEEDSRLNSFGNHTFSIDTQELVKAGFRFTRRGNFVRCDNCELEFDAQNFDKSRCLARYHKDERPDCSFVKKLVVSETVNRNKKFVSYDSLRYEKERLETFINWPISWLKAEGLACDGFYYLRTADHCACVFCRGIVGAWEVGDTPRGEHERHFPHCPFIRGKPVGNISIEQSQILSKFTPSPTVPQSPSVLSADVCGTPRHMAGSYPESSKYQTIQEILALPV